MQGSFSGQPDCASGDLPDEIRDRSQQAARLLVEAAAGTSTV